MEDHPPPLLQDLDRRDPIERHELRAVAVLDHDRVAISLGIVLQLEAGNNLESGRGVAVGIDLAEIDPAILDAEQSHQCLDLLEDVLADISNFIEDRREVERLLDPLEQLAGLGGEGELALMGDIERPPRVAAREKCHDPQIAIADATDSATVNPIAVLRRGELDGREAAAPASRLSCFAAISSRAGERRRRGLRRRWTPMVGVGGRRRWLGLRRGLAFGGAGDGWGFGRGSRGRRHSLRCAGRRAGGMLASA